jgi:hypothetical protein
MTSEDRHWHDLAEVRHRIAKLNGIETPKQVRRPGERRMKPLMMLSQTVKRGFRAAGLEVKKIQSEHVKLRSRWEGNEDEWVTFDAVREFTMAPSERVLALIRAVQHICDNKIPGDFVECGTWRGGNAMVIARTLLAMGETQRKIYLYDEFEGAAPSRPGMSVHGTEEEVIRNVCSTGFPRDAVVTVKGPPAVKLAGTTPDSIAGLLLEADWYDAVQSQLEHAYPRIVPGGIVLLNGYSDQYEYKKAVGDYLRRVEAPVYLHRVDQDSRMFTKT